MLSIFYSSQNYRKAKFFIAVSLRTLIASTRWSQGHTEVWVEWGLRGWGNRECSRELDDKILKAYKYRIWSWQTNQGRVLLQLI